MVSESMHAYAVLLQVSASGFGILAASQVDIHILLLPVQAQMQPMVLPNATVVIGYCFGGSAVLDLAASWPAPMTDDVLGEFSSCTCNCNPLLQVQPSSSSAALSLLAASFMLVLQQWLLMLWCACKVHVTQGLLQQHIKPCIA